MSKELLIERLKLEKHPLEGGYFRRTYESSKRLGGEDNRRLMTSIYYLLTDDQPFGLLHRNKSDIVHYYHQGGPIRYWVVSPEGDHQEYILGNDVANGELPQLLVKGGYWKASMLAGGEYGLISEAVTPGFEYEDNDLADDKTVKDLLPDFYRLYRQFLSN